MNDSTFYNMQDYLRRMIDVYDDQAKYEIAKALQEAKWYLEKQHELWG